MSTGRESYLANLARLLAVAAGLAAVAAFGLRPPSKAPRPTPAVPAAPPPVVVAATEPEPEPEPEPPAPPAPREPDPAAVAEARADLDAASRDRARADARAADAADALETAQTELARLIAEAQTLPLRLKDPSARIARVRQRGEALRVENARLDGELAALLRAPRPRPKPLVDKSPVARPPDGDEFHFELRRGRIAAIDLEGLLDRVRVDARIQLRMATTPRPIHGMVGPVGEYSIEYEMAPESLDLIGGALGRGISASYSLVGWEIIPRAEHRGESLAEALQPASAFARAINSLDPEHDAITFWVYPDSFALYRQLRELLHPRGFLVSARPLPDGMAIRGSPSGSISAGQ